MARRQDNVRLDLTPLQRMQRDIRQGMGSRSSSTRIEAMYRQWAVRYLGFTRRRFLRYSRGGGDWPPLASSTVRRRRAGGKARGGVSKVSVNRSRTGGKAAILRDTSTLFAALEVGRPDNFKRLRGGVRVGFLGRQPAMRRTARGKRTSRITIPALAAIHHFGRGRVPARPIIANPDRQTVQGMLRDKRRAIRGVARRHSRSR